MKRTIQITTKVLKEKSKQSRTRSCDLSFPLQFDVVGHALLNSLRVASVATYSSWFSPFLSFPGEGQT